MGPPSAPTSCSGSGRRRLRLYSGWVAEMRRKLSRTEIVEKERQRLIKAGGDGNAVKWMAASLNDQLKKLGELLPP